MLYYFCPVDYEHFYPRSPCGERHHYGWSWYDDFTISIHALLAESDIAKELALAAKNAVFLSTLSLRRATLFLRSGPMTRRYFYPRSPCGERRMDVLTIFRG